MGLWASGRGCPLGSPAARRCHCGGRIAVIGVAEGAPLCGEKREFLVCRNEVFLSVGNGVEMRGEGRVVRKGR